MKKLIALLLALVMVLGLAACGGEESKKDDDEKEGVVQDKDNDKDEDKDDEGDEQDDAPPVLSDEISLENLMNYPASPEEDFVCEDLGDGVWILTQYLGDDEIVVIPDTWGGKPIDAIGTYTFANSSPVKAIRLSDSISVINDAAFTNNANLEIIVFGSGMRELDDSSGGGSVFMNCTSLHTVVLNDGLEQIGKFCFAVCTSLETIEIPSSVIRFGNAPFYACSEELTIIVSEDSAAEQYANEEGLNVQVNKR